MDHARETLIDLLNEAGIDYNASEKDSVVVSTDKPNVFIEFVFEKGGPLRATRVLDWSEVTHV